MDNSIEQSVASTKVRVAASGSKTIANGVTKYLSIDSGRDGAEILAVIIKGVVGADWTLGVYVPAVDAVASPAAADKRLAVVYTSAETEGGLLEPFAISFNCFLNFTNTSVGSDDIDAVQVVYRSVNALTLAWEA